jgi:hypothetical protein
MSAATRNSSPEQYGSGETGAEVAEPLVGIDPRQHQSQIGDGGGDGTEKYHRGAADLPESS